MRKKIEELRNKEEGFTLVELLAVIVILGIIVAIAIPAIGNVIEKTRTNADEAEVEMIVDAARLYYTIEKDGVISEVSTETLIDEGYLEERSDGDAQDGTVDKDADSGKLKFTPTGG